MHKVYGRNPANEETEEAIRVIIRWIEIILGKVKIKAHMGFEIIIKSLVLIIHSNFFLTLPYDESCSGMIFGKEYKAQIYAK
ncbi:hypothetical protein [Anaplasma phagocytophilum]|uniref:hypothetical protein n=1 Tax=Anaplasma phagocytophilum TaxID=948 RepID=UPI00200C9985|nr:hypothetical protein [Anaplasma phagocytophilum]UQD54647.1 hypothetical protein ESP60_05105 [Anaplasma phagocytophilum]